MAEWIVQVIRPGDGSHAPCVLRLPDRRWDAQGCPVCELEVVIGEKAWTRSAADYFAARALVRRDLEAEGWLLSCYGASRNVYPSGMARDMALGLRAYRLRPGQHARSEDLVEIFATGADVEAASVDDQETFWRNWLASDKR